jgi:O-antigen/teichoic acid export membrane protein
MMMKACRGGIFVNGGSEPPNIGKDGASSSIRQPDIARDTSFFIGADAMATLFGLVSTLILTRMFVEHDYGMWVLILAFFQTWFMFVDMGIPTVMVRDIPRGRSQAKGLLHIAIRIQLLVCCVLFPLGTALALKLWGDDGEWSRAFILLAIAGALPALSEAHRVTLRALGEARREAFSRMLDRFIVSAGMIIAWSAGLNSVLPYAIAATAGPIAALIYAWWIGGKIAERASREGTEGEDDILYSNKALMLLALPYMFTLGMTPLISHLDKFLLKWYLDYEAVALFDVAWKVYAAGLTVATALRKSLLPVYGGLTDKPEQLGKSISAALALARWLIPPGVLFGGAIGIIFIPILFTTRYTNSVSLFLILLGAWSMWALAAPFQVAVQTRISGWNYAGMMGLVVLVDLIAGVILIPKFGVVGAAFSTVIAQIAMLCLAILFSRHIPGVLAMLPSILALASAALIVALCLQQVVIGQLDVVWAIVAFAALFTISWITGWRPKPPFEEMLKLTNIEAEES